MITNLTNVYKEKLQQNGFNVLAVRWINGRKLLCVAVYWNQHDEKIQGVITCIDDHHDEYNGILQTVSWGSKLHLLETVAFFPNIERIKEDWKKLYPNHFSITE